MKFVRAAAVLAALVAGGLAAQDKGTKAPPADKTAAKGPALPLYWDKLGLTDEQKAEVLRLTAEYRPKRQKLLDELAKLDTELARKRVAVLTDDQKRKLVDLAAAEPARPTPVEKGKTGPADKVKPKDKAPDK